MLSLIAAVAENRVIGRDQDLPWHLPDDMKWFKRTTSGHAVITGRRNFEAFGKPLPNRRNLMLTRDESYTFPGVEIVHSLNEALERVRGRHRAVSSSAGRKSINWPSRKSTGCISRTSTPPPRRYLLPGVRRVAVEPHHPVTSRTRRTPRPRFHHPPVRPHIAAGYRRSDVCGDGPYSRRFTGGLGGGDDPGAI